ncbi:SusC/RagA family TonB-linked outer membrane protein [Terrimonas pollutisoli]|uniref:SusC/RagA family TonB-linked outer membrane protein n=1 Tax=Terrimonas pollutisoli TaxID=3034147 RepID=UPI0023ED1BF7|nr:TonB-dependent receptor [Terrimonas sp. H1YJ31]
MTFQKLKRVAISDREKYLQWLPKKNKSFLLIFLLAVCVNASAQQITVKGKVTSGDEALTRVTISVKNKNNNTQTDTEGNYTITTDPNSTLVFSHVGFIAREVAVSNQALINIELHAANLQLNDVVVVGYGTQKKGSITGAVSSIKSSDLMRTPSSTTSTALVGKIPGVTARQTTGRPGAGTTIQIRNLGSPLYVIDGVPQSEGQFNNIAMEDIENISILKDAAASLYGFRASNGVVLVTTKKGKSGKGSLNINTYYQLQNVTRYPSASNAYTYVRALAEAEQNEGKPISITPENLEKWKQGTEPGFQSTNYRDFIIQKNAPQKYVNLNASGGNDKMNYYFSLGGLNQDGILKQYNFERWNFQTNVEGTVIKGVKIGTQLSGRIESRHEPASTTGANTYDNPFLAILTMWPTEHVYANDNPNYINADVNNPSRNPLIYDKKVIGKQDNVWNNFASIFYATIDLPLGLSAKATYSYNYKQNKNELHRNSFNFYSYKPATDAYVPVPFNLALRNKSRQEIKETFAQLQLNYATSVGDHSISAMGAYEYASAVDQSLSINAIPPTNYSPMLRLLDINGFTDGYNIIKRGSVIGRFNYDYKGRYFLELLGRYDGSHIYPPGKRWGLFPGVTAGWRISDESFFGDRLGRIINNLKLRASWGRTGQERGVGAFDYLPGGDFGSGNYVFDGGLVTGTDVRGIPITNITWVTSTTKNIGLELGFFNNKLTAEFDVFSRELAGIPAPKYDVLLPSEVGYSLPNENLNSERTQGIEGIISYNNRSGAIRYSVSANATLARRKILDIYKPRFGNSWDQYRNQTDHRWADVHWGYQVIGQFESIDQIKNYTVNNDGQGNRTQLPGDLIFKDVNGDGLISNLDERPIGYAGLDGSTFGGNTPYMSFGLTANVNYKGFSLTTDWAGATMQSYYRIFELAIPFQAIHNSPEYIFNDRWHRADLFDPNSEWIPGKYPAIRRTSSGNHINYTRHSDFWISNITYLRLRNLELMYDLPKRLVNRAHLSGVKVYVSGTNVLTFDNVKHIEMDPEISQSNGLVYPVVKLYTFGINITL